MNDIEHLQEKIAHQERTIDALNDALTSQQQQISHLQAEIKMLVQLLREWRAESSRTADNNNGGMTHEIPPHY